MSSMILLRGSNVFKIYLFHRADTRPDILFFYVLTRILLDHEPKRIIEFGLGESSKLISAYLGYKNSDAEHLIIEQDEEWGSVFLKKFKLCEQSELCICLFASIR